jgi:hypothetical protein
MLKGLLRIRRYQQETPCALQEAENRSWLRCGEAHSALRDRRPIPAALQFHSVVQCSGTEEILPTTTAYSGRPRREKRTPTNQRSIRKKTCSVKFSRNGVVENSRKMGVWTQWCNGLQGVRGLNYLVSFIPAQASRLAHRISRVDDKGVRGIYWWGRLPLSWPS